MNDRPCNYMNLKTRSPLFAHYVYADVLEYFADALFMKHRVHVFWGKEAEHPEHIGYRLIFCKCFLWEKRRFTDAMKELQRIMDCNGYRDYDEYCNKFLSVLQKYGKE